MDTQSPPLPRIYLSNLPELNWLTGVEFGRVDDGQPSDCWVGLTENIGLLLDEPGLLWLQRWRCGGWPADWQPAP